MPVNLTFDLTGPFTQDHGQWLAQLFEDLVPLCQIPDYDGPLTIVVLPQDSIPELVNILADGGEYKAGPHAAPAVAVPRIIEGSLQCVILLSSAEVLGLSEDTRSDSLISAVLEELLHTRVYATRWLQLGYLDLPELDSRLADLHQIARAMHDEYFVCRRKAVLASTLPLFDAPGRPGYRTIRLLAYGGDVVGSLEAASLALEELSKQMPWGTLMSDHAWPDVRHVLYRQVFEPLSRDAAFRDGSLEDQPIEPIDLASESDFYRDWLNERWPSMLAILRRSFASDLEEMSGALTELRGALERLIIVMDTEARA